MIDGTGPRLTGMTITASSDNNASLAVLIDADNASPGIVEPLLAEVAKLGVASVKRIYGDWTTPNLGQWKLALLEHSIQPIQQFRYTVGKNATDSAMIIDAMDILHNGQVDAFCLVSSDSDYTRLATRIRESGKLVIGIGKQSTPRAFVSACDVFIYTENLEEREAQMRKAAQKQQTLEKLTPAELALINNINQAIDMVGTDDEGWASLSEVGTALRRIDPGFDPRSYGAKQLAQLVRAKKPFFELKKPSGKSVILIRSKEEV